MELLLDTVNLEEIRKCQEIYPITGVTSNPSIIRAEGKISFFSHMRELRSIIGMDKTLHVQVTGLDSETMIREAERITNEIDSKVYIKVPTTEEGLKAMRHLKAAGFGVTATAIYTKVQGLAAILTGADFIAPYCNRMENMDVDFEDTVAYLRNVIDENNSDTKILAASFKNIGQVHRAFAAGAQTVTVQPALLHSAMGLAEIGKAITAFNNDFRDCLGVDSILEL